MLRRTPCLTHCFHLAHKGPITLRYRCCTCGTKCRRSRRPLQTKHTDPNPLPWQDRFTDVPF